MQSPESFQAALRVLALPGTQVSHSSMLTPWLGELWMQSPHSAASFPPPGSAASRNAPSPPPQAVPSVDPAGPGAAVTLGCKVLSGALCLQKAAILTTIGVLEEPLGNARLHGARLMAALLHTNTPSINQELCRLNTMGLLLVSDPLPAPPLPHAAVGRLGRCQGRPSRQASGPQPWGGLPSGSSSLALRQPRPSTA